MALLIAYLSLEMHFFPTVNHWQLHFYYFLKFRTCPVSEKLESTKHSVLKTYYSITIYLYIDFNYGHCNTAALQKYINSCYAFYL